MLAAGQILAEVAPHQPPPLLLPPLEGCDAVPRALRFGGREAELERGGQADVQRARAAAEQELAAEAQQDEVLAKSQVPDDAFGGGADGPLLLVPVAPANRQSGAREAADRRQQIVAVEQLAHQRPVEEAETQAARGLGGDGLAAAGLETRDGYDGHGAPGD